MYTLQTVSVRTQNNVCFICSRLEVYVHLFLYNRCTTPIMYYKYIAFKIFFLYNFLHFFRTVVNKLLNLYTLHYLLAYVYFVIKWQRASSMPRLQNFICKLFLFHNTYTCWPLQKVLMNTMHSNLKICDNNDSNKKLNEWWNSCQLIETVCKSVCRVCHHCTTILLLLFSVVKGRLIWQ